MNKKSPHTRLMLGSAGILVKADSLI